MLLPLQVPYMPNRKGLPWSLQGWNGLQKVAALAGSADSSSLQDHGGISCLIAGKIPLREVPI